jgi:hypothetical protein
MVGQKFKIPIYGGAVTVYYGKSLEYISNKYKVKDLSNYGAVTMANPKDEFKNYIVAFEYVSGSIIAHEVVHLINYLFLDVGVELDRTNDETQAYLTGFFFEKIEGILLKLKNDGGKK